MNRQRWAVLGFGVAGFVCAIAYAVIAGTQATRVMSYGADAPEAQLGWLGEVAKLVSGFGGVGGIVGAIVAFCVKWQPQAQSVIDLVKPGVKLPAVPDIADEIELVNAVIAWQQKRDDSQAFARVVLAVVHEAHDRVGLPEEVLDRAGDLAVELAKAIYAPKATVAP